MASLEFAGDNGSLSDINATQGEFRSQIAALTDMVKQIAGNAAVSAGDSAQADPLNAPFTLYVNPYTGSDEFVGGSYNDYETGVTQAEIIESKLKRLEKQRLTCGFTPQRPFKTINRAAIEAAIITSKDWYTITDPAAHVDCVSIVLSAGVHTLYNDPGQASTSIASWGAYRNPTTADLIKFNPATVGGVLLPRGCSLCGPDLRKTTIRPNWVPAVADEAADYSNRHGMLKITGTGYFFGHTVMDKIGLEASHHLLDAYQFTSKAELDDFYAKTFSAVGSGADLASALTVTRGTEYQIVGPIDQTQTPTAAWDTVSSASPYIFNVSIRSNYGMGGAFMDGSKVEGLKSMVCANFTGVSLQKDMSCWQIYNGSNWVQPTYEQYIAADPDNTRMNPARLSRHISAINDAFIQEVSVFAIGQGIHHFTDLGGEITVTNSNSSFGGCAAYSKGYKGTAFPIDTNWAVSGIRVPLDLQEKTGNIRYIYLGTTSAVTSSKITLDANLAADPTSSDTPSVLLQDGYSFASGTYIWIENPLGDPWYAPLASNAWQSSAPDEIDISSAFDGTDATTEDGTNLLLGKRVYIRRLVDTRTPNERRVSILANNTASARLPQRNFIVQTDPLRSNGAISREFTTTGTEIFAVSNAGAGNEAGVTTSTEFTLRRSAPSTTYSNGDFYTAGSVVRADSKHYVATRDVYAATASPDPGSWLETYVHTASDYDAEDPITQEARQITIDTDTDTDAYSTDLGINWSSVWAADEYRGSTDYKGVHAFLVAIGLTSSQAHAALVPQAAADRLLDPTSASDFPNAPSGGAATGRGNWAIEFRRPSTLRLYGHAWEWAGFLNYSKAIPAAQKDLGPQNAFTYYFTNEAGGRVVPQGSNENGFNITPRGLEDIETGSTLTVENIGSSSIDIIAQTEFENLNVTDTLTAENLNITGTISGLPTVGSATAGNTDEDLGFVRLASISDLESTSIASNDAAINASPEAVTLQGLNYWKNFNNLLSARSGTQYVYVDPVNGRNASVQQLLDEPPNVSMAWDGSKWSKGSNQPAKSLSAAISYATATFSPSEIVEFRIGPGLYLESGNKTFTMEARITAWDFSTQEYLNNAANGGTTPFDAANFYDHTQQPTFITKIEQIQLYKSTGQTALLIFTSGLRFTFERRSTITGVAWWGAQQTLNSSTVPDSWFGSTGDYVSADRTDPTNWRALAIADFGNAFNYYIRAQAVDAANIEGTAGQVFGMRAFPVIKFESQGTIANVAIGAMTPADDVIRGDLRNTSGGIISLGAEEVGVSGLCLMGNVRVDSSQNTGSYSNIKLRDGSSFAGSYDVATYELSGFAPILFTCEGNGEISVRFGTALGATGTVGTNTRVYNNPWSNIRLFNTEATPAIASNVSSAAGSSGYWRELGPAFNAIFDKFSTFAGTTNRSWSQYWVSPTGSSGFEGKFGNYNTIANASANVRTTGLIYSLGWEITDFGTNTPTTIFRVAGSGDLPSIDSGVTSPGDIGSYTDFNDLNVRVRTIRQGIDVDAVRTAHRTIVL